MLDFSPEANTKPFELTEKQALQRDLAASPARHILAYGGSRSGKTFGFVRCIVARAFMAPKSRHGIFRLHNVDVKQAVMMDTFPKVMDVCWPGVPYHVNKSDQYVSLGQDSEIWFAGLDDKERVEKVLGKEFATVYPNECSQIPYSSILAMRTRLAQNCVKINGERLALKAYYDLNPTGRKHWTYSEFVEGVNPVDKQPMPEGVRAVLQMNPADNPHLDQEYHDELEALPLAERIRYKEGNYASDLPNSLWPTSRIDETRVNPSQVPPLVRVVVGCDPSGSTSSGGDSQGIVVAGLGTDGHCYILADDSVNLSPAGWGKQCVDSYEEHEADCIVAEANYGGAMVESTIKVSNDKVKVKLVHASRGKHVRAEPVAALYERTKVSEPRVHHVGVFEDLEDQMSQFNNEGYQGGGSPDRADALVWAVTDLMLGKPKKAGMLVKSASRS